MNWIKENWLKLALLVVIFWFIWILQNGIEIEINHKGTIDFDLDHSGYIEDEYSLAPGLPKLR